jgi:hypothetical protein
MLSWMKDGLCLLVYICEIIIGFDFVAAFRMVDSLVKAFALFDWIFDLQVEGI